MRARLRQAIPRAAALALLAVAVLLVAGTFVHTDDGCAVERHCLACRFALHTADAIAPLPASRPTPGSPEDVRLPRIEQVGSGQVVVLAPRGPPAA